MPFHLFLQQKNRQRFSSLPPFKVIHYIKTPSFSVDHSFISTERILCEIERCMEKVVRLSLVFARQAIVSNT